MVFCHCARGQTGQNSSHLNNSFRASARLFLTTPLRMEGNLIVENDVEEGTVRGKALIATEQPSGPTQNKRTHE